MATPFERGTEVVPRPVRSGARFDRAASAWSFLIEGKFDILARHLQVPVPAKDDTVIATYRAERAWASSWFWSEVSAYALGRIGRFEEMARHIEEAYVVGPGAARMLDSFATDLLLWEPFALPAEIESPEPGSFTAPDNDAAFELLRRRSETLRRTGHADAEELRTAIALRHPLFASFTYYEEWSNLSEMLSSPVEVRRQALVGKILTHTARFGRSTDQLRRLVRSTDASWAQLRPLINAAVATLPITHQHSLVRRFIDTIVEERAPKAAAERVSDAAFVIGFFATALLLSGVLSPEGAAILAALDVAAGTTSLVVNLAEDLEKNTIDAGPLVGQYLGIVSDRRVSPIDVLFVCVSIASLALGAQALREAARRRPPRAPPSVEPPAAAPPAGRSGARATDTRGVERPATGAPTPESRGILPSMRSASASELGTSFQVFGPAPRSYREFERYVEVIARDHVLAGRILVGRPGVINDVVQREQSFVGGVRSAHGASGSARYDVIVEGERPLLFEAKNYTSIWNEQTRERGIQALLNTLAKQAPHHFRNAPPGSSYFVFINLEGIRADPEVLREVALRLLAELPSRTGGVLDVENVGFFR